MRWIKPIVWSTDAVALRDPVQRRWYIRQVLLHGHEEDIRTLHLREVARLLDDLNQPESVYRLWRAFLEWKGHMSTPRIVLKGGGGHDAV